MAHYSYDPTRIAEPGLHRMRFELGDVMVEGGEDTSALSDEEYEAVLARFPDQWGKAKLALAESILRRFHYEVDTKVGGLSLALRQRAVEWKILVSSLRAEQVGHGVSAASPRRSHTLSQPYFREGLHENHAFGGTEGGGRRVP